MHEIVLTDPARISRQGPTWSRSFPATPDQAGEARRFLATVVGNHPAAADAITCLAELAANAIIHSRSARPGGAFAVRLQYSEWRIRIEVTDQGGPWGSPQKDLETGRGLSIVQALSARQGIILTGHISDPGQRTVWCELSAEDLAEGSALSSGQGRIT